jgi:hypothetical protein
MLPDQNRWEQRAQFSSSHPCRNPRRPARPFSSVGPGPAGARDSRGNPLNHAIIPWVRGTILRQSFCYQRLSSRYKYGTNTVRMVPTRFRRPWPPPAPFLHFTENFMLKMRRLRSRSLVFDVSRGGRQSVADIAVTVEPRVHRRFDRGRDFGGERGTALLWIEIKESKKGHS